MSTVSSEQRQRDGASLIVLGIFFMVQGAFVLLGGFQLKPSIELVVALVAGGFVFLIGLTMFAVGRRFNRLAAQAARRAAGPDKPQ